MITDAISTAKLKLLYRIFDSPNLSYFDIPRSFNRDIDIWSAMVMKSAQIIKKLPKDMRQDSEIMRHLVLKNPAILNYVRAPKSLTEEDACEVVKHSMTCYAKLPKEFKENEKIIKTVLKQHVNAYPYLPKEYRLKTNLLYKYLDYAVTPSFESMNIPKELHTSRVFMACLNHYDTFWKKLPVKYWDVKFAVQAYSKSDNLGYYNKHLFFEKIKDISKKPEFAEECLKQGVPYDMNDFLRSGDN